MSTNANSVANLAGGNLVASFDHFANDLMTNTDWQWAITPAAVYCVDVRATHSTGFNLDIDIAILERLWLELQGQVSVQLNAVRKGLSNLFLLEFGPFLLVFDHEPFEGIWISHIEVEGV